MVIFNVYIDGPFQLFSEMAYYFRLIFSRLEGGNLFTLIPHIEGDAE